MSLDPVMQRLIGSGSPFELVGARRNEREIKVYRHAPGTLPELYQRALKKAQRELIVCGEWRLTFAQSYALAERVAALLSLKYAVGSGSRVAVVADGTPDWLEAFIAITLLGAVPVLVGHRGAQQVGHCIELTRCALVIADASYLAPSTLDGGPGWIEVRELIASAQCMEFQPFLRPAPDPAHEAVVLFTSGSTGLPKAVSLSHLNVISGLMNMMLGSALAAAEDRDRAPVITRQLPCALIHTPLCYIGGMSAVLMSIMNGTRIVVTREWNIDEVCALVETEKVTSLPHVGRSQLEALLNREATMARLTSIGLHGASVPRKLVEHIADSVPALKIISGYGLTETSGSISVISGGTLRSRPGSSGRIVPTVDVRIGGVEAGSSAAAGAGELFLSGACVMRGYLQQESASELDWFGTGDVAHIAADGHVYFDHRSSDATIVEGSRVNGAAMERKLENLDGVAEVSVLATTELEQFRFDIAVAIIPGREVKRALIEKAVASMVEPSAPVRIHFCESLPRTSSGKIDRAALRALLPVRSDA